jgi:hypothetical protein
MPESSLSNVSTLALEEDRERAILIFTWRVQNLAQLAHQRVRRKWLLKKSYTSIQQTVTHDGLISVGKVYLCTLGFFSLNRLRADSIV